MDLERLNLEVRPRSHYQALDLGLLMGRRWFVALFALFALPVTAIFLLAGLVFREEPYWAVLLVWWLKPAFERLPLLYLSRVIFADTPSLRQAFAAWREALTPGLLVALTLYRLSPRRSFNAPVWVLEHASGRRARERQRVLGRRAGNAAFWLTIMNLHIESFLALSAIALCGLFLPDGMLLDAFSSNVTPVWLNWLAAGASLLGILLVGPFYVSCGFALYLNRRAELEAWDIEVGFRRLAARVALVVGLAVGLSGISPTHADDPEDPRTIESRQLITTVLEEESFHQTSTFRYPAVLEDWFAAEEDAREPMDIAQLIRVIATVAEAVLWIAVVSLLVWVAFRLRWMDWSWARREGGSGTLPARVLGVSIEEGQLPTNVEISARELWADGDARGALSLMLRSALITLVERRGCRFRVGDTERRCIAEVRRQCPAEETGAFQGLVSLWLRVAYAHQQPAVEEFDRCLSMWRAHWGRAS